LFDSRVARSAFVMTMLSCVPVTAQEVLQSSHGDRIQALAEVFAATVQFQGTIRVDMEGATVVDYSYGLANIGAGTANTTETQFYIASITKAFTAVLALQQVDARRLELDASIAPYFPELKKEISGHVTLRHLLTHSSGITRDYTEALIGDGPFSTVDLVRGLNASELLFEPGTRYEYSNTGYVLVALMVAHVTGKDYIRLLENNIASPAGLLNTTVGPGRNTAEGYESEDLLTLHAVDVDVAANTALLGAGGLFSTTDDLIRFTKAIADGRLLSPEMLELMLTAADVENADGTGGMGWTMYPAGPDVRLIAATGVADGYMSFLAWMEDDPTTTMSMLINDRRIGRRGSNALFMGLLNLMLGADVPIEAPPTPLYSFLNILLKDGETAAMAYSDGLDWSHPPVANAAASQATGAPNGGVGETMFAWAPATADAGEEWLTLAWDRPLLAHAVIVTFTQIPGVLTGVDLGSGMKSLSEFRLEKSESDDRAPIVTINFNKTVELGSLTLHMNTAEVPGWPQIDAVGIVDEDGDVHWADEATASSSAFAASGVGMHDLPTRETLAKLARRLEENGRTKEADAVLRMLARMEH
jgi:CubicO group peptidase (beta-lactamase class C family)